MEEHFLLEIISEERRGHYQKTQLPQITPHILKGIVPEKNKEVEQF